MIFHKFENLARSGPGTEARLELKLICHNLCKKRAEPINSRTANILRRSTEIAHMNRLAGNFGNVSKHYAQWSDKKRLLGGIISREGQFTVSLCPSEG
jgi:hypothetical protein